MLNGNVPTRMLLAGVMVIGWAALPAAATSERVPVWGPDIFGGYASDHVLVQFQPGVLPVNLEAGGVTVDGGPLDALLADTYQVSHSTAPGFSKAKNVALARQLGMDRWRILHVPAGTDTPAMVADLNRFGRWIEKADIDGIGGVAEIPNDTHFNLQYGVHNTGQVIQGSQGIVDADMDGPEAWDIHTGTGDIVLAVIDSGVDPHPDFASKMIPGHATVGDPNNTLDQCPHGTHVSGIAGAIGNNGLGVAGVSWGVTIMPVRVLTGCNGNAQQCADGIVWATDNGAHVGTMSLQYYTGASTFQPALDYARAMGVLMIAATGNNRGRQVANPAALPNCLAVGALTNQDVRAGFSNYGPEIDVSSAGQDVYSTWVGNSYTYLSGTSLATPHVSGLACLVLSHSPTQTPADLEQILKDCCDDVEAPGWDERTGWGRVNAFTALNLVADLDPPFIVHDGGLSTYPFSGYVDPRLESDDGVNVNQGIDTVLISFNEEVRNVGGGPLTAAAFTVSVTGGVNPGIASINASGNPAVLIELGGRIPLQEWLTIEANVEDTAGNEIVDSGNQGPGVDEADRVDIAFLPGDEDQNGTVQPLDNTEFRGIFSGAIVPARGTPEDYVDIDRDGAVVPLDLTRWRQMFGGFPPTTRNWMGESLNAAQP